VLVELVELLDLAAVALKVAVILVFQELTAQHLV
jgi:hypothetical protein